MKIEVQVVLGEISKDSLVDGKLREKKLRYFLYAILGCKIWDQMKKVRNTRE